MKIIKWLNHKWYVEGKSALDSEYIKLRRVAFNSDLKRFNKVATVIDIAKSDLVKNNIIWE